MKVTLRDNTQVLIGRISDALSMLNSTSGVNRGIVARCRDNDDSDFRGGSMEALTSSLSGKVDLSRHKAALAQFEKSGIGQKIKAQTDANRARRKVRLSDEDGNFEYTRRFDDKIFVQSYKALQVQKIVEIDCNFSISYKAKSHEIDKFGAFVWSICNLIESAGFVVKINFVNKGRGLFVNKKWNHEISLVVKEPGQYLSPSVLAAVFSSNFFRRAGFAALAGLGNALNEEVNKNLGYPERSQPIETKNGRLVISADAATAADDKLVSELLKIFKTGGK